MVIIPSLFFTLLAEKNIENSRSRFLIFSLIAVLIPSIFAGIRGEKIGTDVLVYAKPEFLKALANGSLIRYLKVTQTDLGYAFIVGISALYLRSFNVLLTLTAFLQVLPVYIVAYELRNRINMTQVMYVFFAMYYIMGFNIMRQQIAASLMLLCFAIIIKRKYQWAIIIFIMAWLFHSTAIIGLAFIVLGLAVFKIHSNKLRLFIIFSFISLILVIFPHWRAISESIMNIGFLPANKMQRYIDVFSGINVGEKAYMFELKTPLVVDIIFKALLTLIAIICTTNIYDGKICIYKRNKNESIISSVICIAIVGALIDILFLVIFHSAYAYRIVIYAEYFLILLIPFACGRIEKFSENGRYMLHTNLKHIACNLILFSYFFLIYMCYGQYETLPFYFQIY